MDIITDLTAETVSYITAIQDICKYERNALSIQGQEDIFLWEAFERLGTPSEKCLLFYRARINEIVWSSEGFDNIELKQHYFLQVAKRLLDWLKPFFEQPKKTADGRLPDLENMPGLWAGPNYWRQNIKEILYRNISKRKGLVFAINYMPLLIIEALAVKRPDVYQQRLYQFYIYKEHNEEEVNINIKENPALLLNNRDFNKAIEFWAGYDVDKDTTDKKNPDRIFRLRAIELLQDDTALLARLNEREITVPFESLFQQELDEIEKSRNKRLLELNTADKLKFPLPIPLPSDNNDPWHKADEMELAALAFSGGGIRSATFNLGVLQKLAELGALPRFDYLSTVSGGGYIGTWFSSWVLRDGSIKKVNSRLNKNISSDPLAEEVRPIRWLRMFSNYLSPNASIMSADSWTMGITWVRNTMINQVILLLLLLTVLSFISAVNDGWEQLKDFKANFGFQNVCIWSIIIVAIGSFLSGIGMRTYDKSHPPQSKFNLGKSWILAQLLIGWAAVSSFMIAHWFLIGINKASNDYLAKVELLSAVFWPCFIGMLAIAFIGGYHRAGEKRIAKTSKYPIQLIAAISISSFVASLSGIAVLAGAWQLIELLHNISEIKYSSMLALVFGVPLVLESISIMVVVRMTLMGSYFPDERREWWGRIGALLHRFMLCWILIAVAALVLPICLEDPNKVFGEIMAFIGGWGAIITFAVKLAFQSKTPSDKPTGSNQFLEMFIRIAPYLFILGFLLIGAYTLKVIDGHILNTMPNPYHLYRFIICTVVLGAITFILSWRVGVNEFSLHDFYKNRLVRAYMGATRRRTDRENTANSFTGFDKDDDLPLALMRTDKSYTGPYPLINTTLNASTVSELDRQDRMAESFVFSPLYCGFDFSPTRSSSYTKDQVFNYGYRPTEHYSGPTGPLMGTAMAISGAAVSPNMGYHSSAATAFLMTVFNVRLGRWMGNPRKNNWKRSDPVSGLGYLVKDLIGKSDIDADYVCLSDGGHFDNMGLYELVRRRCNYIVLGDAEEDSKAICEGLANAIRRCRIDFGVEIDLDVTPITEKNKDTQFCLAHIIKGTIKYPNSKLTGKIIYIKTALTGDEEVDIREYFLSNPDFPQQSTGDQFFDEAQFESYRKLGYHSIEDLNDLI